MFNLASEPKEHFNIGLDIPQANNMDELANGISHN